MIGAAELLALDLPLPRRRDAARVTEAARTCAAPRFAADELFGEEPNEARALRDLIERVAAG